MRPFFSFPVWFQIFLINCRTAISDKIARAFNRSGATQSVALDISKAFDRVWHAGVFHKLRSYGISGQIFGLISSFLSNRQLLVVLDGKSSSHKNIQLILEFFKAPFLVLHFSYYTLTTFLIMLSVLLLSTLTILISILSEITHLLCGNNQNWLLNLNLVCKTLDWSRKWLVDFNVGKTQLVSLDLSNNTGAIDAKMDGSVIEEKFSKLLGLTFSFKLDWGSYSIYC